MKKPTVFGIGINDETIPTQKFEKVVVDGEIKNKLVWVCKYYRKWKDMLKRCYYQKTFQTYFDCEVCDSWLIFSEFKTWCKEQEELYNIDIATLHLDKDLLITGNKIYSPETCLFVHSKVNTFILDSGAARGDFPLGVCLNKTKTKYESWCRYPLSRRQTYLGVYETPEEAHEAWRHHKEKYAKLLIEDLNIKDSRVISILENKYKEEFWYS